MSLNKACLNIVHSLTEDYKLHNTAHKNVWSKASTFCEKFI